MTFEQPSQIRSCNFTGEIRNAIVYKVLMVACRDKLLKRLESRDILGAVHCCASDYFIFTQLYNMSKVQPKNITHKNGTFK